MGVDCSGFLRVLIMWFIITVLKLMKLVIGLPFDLVVIATTRLTHWKGEVLEVLIPYMEKLLKCNWLPSHSTPSSYGKWPGCTSLVC